MGYEIREIDIRNTDDQEEIVRLVDESYNRKINETDVLLNTFLERSGPKSIYLGAFSGEQLVGFNAFLAHRLIFKGRWVDAYQSCWTCTSPAFRGQRIFFNIMEKAKELLKHRNAAFLFGFPNENSYPI